MHSFASWSLVCAEEKERRILESNICTYFSCCFLFSRK
jgi:hypothetical protein